MPIDKYYSYSKWRLNQTGFYQISEWKEEGGDQDKINTFTAIVDLSRFNNSCLKSRQRRP